MLIETVESVPSTTSWSSSLWRRWRSALKENDKITFKNKRVGLCYSTISKYFWEKKPSAAKNIFSVIFMWSIATYCEWIFYLYKWLDFKKNSDIKKKVEILSCQTCDDLICKHFITLIFDWQTSQVYVPELIQCTKIRIRNSSQWIDFSCATLHFVSQHVKSCKFYLYIIQEPLIAWKEFVNQMHVTRAT